MFIFDEDRVSPELQHPIHKDEQATDKLNEIKKRTPKRKIKKPERTVQADNGKKTVRLHFKETDQKKPSKLAHVAKDALSAEIHNQVEDSADDNVAVKSS